MSTYVLDASALLAYLQDEPGAEIVAEAVAEGAVVSTVNLAEVLGSAAELGREPRDLAEELRRSSLLDGAIAVEPFTAVDAVEAARLRRDTRRLGLSLGDRACIATATRLEAPALTADAAWGELDLDLELRQIR